MHQLLNEFNQSKINKIVTKFKGESAWNVLNLREYETQTPWIKAAVMHMDHLRQNRRQLMRMKAIMKILTNSLTVAEYFEKGWWEYIDYTSFVRLVNCFEPSMQMRQAQQMHTKQEQNNDYAPQQHPIVLQDDDHFLMMRAETANAAIEAKERIQAITKQTYTWCISDKDESKNLFMRYRNDYGKATTAYFVLDKTKQPSDAWHAFVIHLGKSSIMLTNAANKDPKIMSDAAINDVAQGLDVSKLILQPLTKAESNASKESVYSFMNKTYDEKTEMIQSANRSNLTLDYYKMLDGKQQYLFFHHLSPTRTEEISEAVAMIMKIMMPFHSMHYARHSLFERIIRLGETSVHQLLQELPQTKELLDATWSAEAKDYYEMIVQRAVDNAAQIIQKHYV